MSRPRHRAGSCRSRHWHFDAVCLLFRELAAPETEITDLFGLLKAFIRRDLAELHREGVKIKVIGDRVSLQEDLRILLQEAEETTRGNTALTLVIAFNYGSRDEIARAVQALARDVAAGLIAPLISMPQPLVRGSTRPACRILI